MERSLKSDVSEPDNKILVVVVARGFYVAVVVTNLEIHSQISGYVPPQKCQSFHRFR